MVIFVDLDIGDDNKKDSPQRYHKTDLDTENVLKFMDSCAERHVPMVFIRSFTDQIEVCCFSLKTRKRYVLG